MTDQSASGRGQAVEQFNTRERRTDGEQIIGRLDNGLTLLRELCYGRLHFDVERIDGTDSMLIPLSESKAKHATLAQLEIYQVVESAAMVHEGRYVSGDGEWYLRWLAGFRLAGMGAESVVAGQLAAYRSKSAHARRHALIDDLLRVLPESRRTPLVLFRLFPLAVHLATAMAFGDRRAVDDLRQRQAALLPAIMDCTACRGAVLNDGEVCGNCSNPLWKYELLSATD